MLSSLAISLMPQNAFEWDCPTLLDINAVKPLLTWLTNNSIFQKCLVDGRWHIGLLEPHLESRSNWVSLRKQLEQANIAIIEYTFDRNDALLVAEIQRAYFGGDAESRRSAELLAYGRRHNDGENIQIISRHRSFRLIPQVNLFYIENTQEIGQEDSAIFLRLIQTLDLHDHVRRVAYQRMFNRDYAGAIAETTKTFIDEIRTIGEDNKLSFVENINDQPMVDQAIRNEERDAVTGKKKDITPAIQLNDLKRPSDKSEQKGYRDIMCGVVSAVRNPTAHAPVDKEFLQERFGDQRTALKFLCMLSLLFEKLDKRVAP